MSVEHVKPEFFTANRATAVGPFRVAVFGSILGLAAALVGVNVGGFAWPFTVSHVLVLVAFALVVLDKTARIAGMRMTGFDLLFLVYILIRLVVELVNASELDHPPSLGLVIEFVVVYLSSWPARVVVSDLLDLSRFIRFFCFPAIFVAVIGVLQIAGVEWVNNLVVENTTSPGLVGRLERDTYLRGTSTIGHWTALGGYLDFIAALACVDLLLTRKRTGKVPFYPLFVLMAALAGQVSTLTFATIFLTLLIIGFTLLNIGIRLRVVIPIVIGSVVAWQLFGASINQRIDTQLAPSNYTSDYPWLPESIAYRMLIWTTETIPSIFERPLTGWGVNVYAMDWVVKPTSLIWTSPESEWMRTAVTVGLPALAIQIVLLIVVWREVLVPAGRYLGLAIWPLKFAYIGIVVISFSHSHLTNRGVPLVLWVIVGALIPLATGQGASTSNANAARRE